MQVLLQHTYIINSIYYMMVITVDEINYTTEVRVVDTD